MIVRNDLFDAASTGIVAGPSVLANDVVVGSGSVIGVGGRSTPGADRGFWWTGSQGGGFWIGVSGEVWFFPGDDFATLAPGASVETSVVYRVADETGAVDEAVVTARVSVAAGPPPAATNDALSVAAGQLSSAPLSLFANDTGEGLRITRLGDAAAPDDGGAFVAQGDGGGRFEVTADGGAVFLPGDDFATLAPGETARSTARYVVADANGRYAEAVIAATVEGAAAALAAADDRASMLSGDADSDLIALLANDAGENLRIVAAGGRSEVNADGGFWVAGDAGGRFWIRPDGDAFFFDRGDFDDLASGESAVSSVRYVVKDAAGRTAEASVSVQISPEARSPYEFGDSRVIERPEKIGLGVWDEAIPGYDKPMDYFNTLNAGWYYNWDLQPLEGETHMDFVPMVWDEKAEYFGEALHEAADRYGVVLGFNEPDIQSQADMSVELALELWPQLEATGARLGSPSAAGSPLKSTTRPWADEFLAAAEEQDLQIDFLGLHTYTFKEDVSLLRDRLIRIYEKYQKPVWITEFGLVNWLDRDRFSEEQIAEFLTESFLMLDDLTFVERHAWFSPQLHPGGINTYFLDEQGQETGIADAYHTLFA